MTYQRTDAPVETSIKCGLFMGLSSNSKMYSKAIVFFAFLAMAVAAMQPRIGHRMPSIKPRFTTFETRVVGGSSAPVGYSFIVSLQMYGQHFCGGSIINSYWIITAAHCIYGMKNSNQINVVAGKLIINRKEPTEQTVTVAKSFIHENYKGGVGPFDVALLKLASPLKLNNNVQAIALAPPNSEPTGEAWLCGWGSTSTTSRPIMPTILQHVKMEYMDRKACDKAMGSRSLVGETNVCTAPKSKPTSACSGDSGGPLFSYKGGKPELTGIVSWGTIPCGTPGKPSVYAKVSYFDKWIKQKILN